jgi:hypothetical protein
MEDCTPNASESLGDGPGEHDAPARTRYGRRALMLGAGAAGAGIAAGAAFGATQAGAEGEAVTVGGTFNDATSTTQISTSSGNGLNGITTSDETYACGVLGQSKYGTGVYGTQSSTSGLLGSSSAAVVGDTGNGQGVLGLSSTGDGVSGASTSGAGVSGVSTNGSGVIGQINGDSTRQSAVVGLDNSFGDGGGFGVSGSSEYGIGVYASGPVGLSVYGVANFSRSGLATVAGTASAPAQTVKVTGVALTSSSLILATPQGVVKKVAVEGVVPDVSGSSFKIYLTKAITVSLDIAWFVVG